MRTLEISIGSHPRLASPNFIFNGIAIQEEAPPPPKRAFDLARQAAAEQLRPMYEALEGHAQNSRQGGFELLTPHAEEIMGLLDTLNPEELSKTLQRRYAVGNSAQYTLPQFLLSLHKPDVTERLIGFIQRLPAPDQIQIISHPAVTEGLTQQGHMPKIVVQWSTRPSVERSNTRDCTP